MKIAFTPIIFLFLLSACKEKSKYRKAAEEIESNMPNTKNMNAGKEKYTLAVPVGWTTEHSNEYGIDYYFLLAPKTKEDPNTNINVITEFMQNLNLDEFSRKTIQGLKNAIPSVTILEQGDITANGINGIWYSYSMEPQGIKATLVCYIFTRNGIAYIINAGTQTKDATRYRSTFDLVAKSFKFDN